MGTVGRFGWMCLPYPQWVDLDEYVYHNKNPLSKSENKILRLNSSVTLMGSRLGVMFHHYILAHWFF